MVAGFQVFNSAGFLQIDQDSMCLHYITKGLTTTTTPLSFSSRGGIIIDIPISVQIPIIAWQSYGSIGPYYTINLGNGYIRHTFNTDLNPGINVGYYLFDLASSFSSIGYGLEIYSAASQLVFSSGHGIASIYDAIVGGSGEVSLAPGRSYATCIPSFGGTRTQVYAGNPDIPDPNGRYVQTGLQYGGYIRSSGGVYRAGAGLMDYLSSSNAGYAPDFSIPLQACLIIDVTPFGNIDGLPSINNNPQPTTPQSPTWASFTDNTSSEILSGSTSSRSFSQKTVATGGGSPVSYSWSFSSTAGGSWVWNVSSSTPHIGSPSVSGVANNDSAFASGYCSVLFSDGSTRNTITVNYTYNRGNG